jgi:hypothetical protein
MTMLIELVGSRQPGSADQYLSGGCYCRGSCERGLLMKVPDIASTWSQSFVQQSAAQVPRFSSCMLLEKLNDQERFVVIRN